MAIFTKKIKVFSRQNFSKGSAIHRISNVYLTYIYRISNVYLPCLIKQRQITRDKALDSEYQSLENKIMKK